MFQKITFYRSLLVIIISTLLVVLIVYAFSEPTQPPPGGNVPAPLNVGSSGQAKTGGLILNTGGAATGLIVDKGNVGIGTREPTQKLDVAGYVKGRSGLCIGNDCRTSWPAGDSGYWAASGVNIYNTNSGNVGIGTTAPSQKLDVIGYVRGSEGLCIGNDCRTSWPAGDSGYWAASGVNIYNTNSGNVGIGTTGPGAKLELAKSITGAEALLSLHNTRNAWGTSGDSIGLKFLFNNGNGIAQEMANVYVNAQDLNSGFERGNMFLRVRDYNVGGMRDAVTILSSGNVGIGTREPTQKLDVAGFAKGRSGLCIGDDCRTSWPDGRTTVYRFNILCGDPNLLDVLTLSPVCKTRLCNLQEHYYYDCDGTCTLVFNGIPTGNIEPSTCLNTPVGRLLVP